MKQQLVLIVAFACGLCAGAASAQNPPTTKPSARAFPALTAADTWCFIDVTGKQAFPGEFKSAGRFAEELAWVRTEKGVGYIDLRGEWVVKPSFEDGRNFSEGLAAVMDKDGQWGFIDRKGKQVIAPSYAVVTDFADGRAGFFKQGPAGKGLLTFDHGRHRGGYIDRAGRVVIAERFERLRPFSGGLARVVEDKRWCFIKTDGTVAFDIVGTWRDAAPEFSEGFVAAEGEFLDAKGKRAFGKTFTEVTSFGDGFAAVRNDKHWFYINLKGEAAIEAAEGERFVLARPFSEGMAYVETEKGWCGYVDRAGKKRFTTRVFRRDESAVTAAMLGVQGGYGQFQDGLATFLIASDVGGEMRMQFGYVSKEGDIVYEVTLARVPAER